MGRRWNFLIIFHNLFLFILIKRVCVVREYDFLSVPFRVPLPPTPVPCRAFTTSFYDYNKRLDPSPLDVCAVRAIRK